MTNNSNQSTGAPRKTQWAMFSVEDLADRWSCSTRHVYRLADEGRIPQPIKLGTLARWPRSVIEIWESEGCPKVLDNTGEQPNV